MQIVLLCFSVPHTPSIKLTTGGIGSFDEGLFQLSLVHDDWEGISSGNFNYTEPYDDEKGKRTRYYPDMIIGLYDKKFETKAGFHFKFTFL